MAAADMSKKDKPSHQYVFKFRGHFDVKLHGDAKSKVNN